VSSENQILTCGVIASAICAIHGDPKDGDGNSWACIYLLAGIVAAVADGIVGLMSNGKV
jgi:hypothetical protein